MTPPALCVGTPTTSKEKLIVQVAAEPPTLEGPSVIWLAGVKVTAPVVTSGAEMVNVIPLQLVPLLPTAGPWTLRTVSIPPEGGSCEPAGHGNPKEPQAGVREIEPVSTSI